MKKIKPHNYKLIIRDISEGNEEAFDLFIPAFHVHCYGETIKKALESYYLYFDKEKGRREKGGVSMPKADVMPEKLRQVPLRLPESIYDRIMALAKSRGMSFNAFVVDVLMESE